MEIVDLPISMVIFPSVFCMFARPGSKSKWLVTRGLLRKLSGSHAEDYPIDERTMVIMVNLWYKVVPPKRYVYWFINPMNTYEYYRYITNKNHSYWSYKPTERCLGGTTL